MKDIPDSPDSPQGKRAVFIEGISETDKRTILYLLQNQYGLEKLPNTRQSAQREKMYYFALEHFEDHAEKINKWLGKINKLRADGSISDTDEGVTIEGIGVLASKAVHDRVLEEKFPGNVIVGEEQNNYSLNKSSDVKMVRKHQLDDYLSKNNGKLESGNFSMETKEFLIEEIFLWISRNFDDVKDQYDKLYLLQLINPDMSGRFWFNSTNNDGSRLAFGGQRRVNHITQKRTFGDEMISWESPSIECGVFLIGKA